MVATFPLKCTETSLSIVKLCEFNNQASSRRESIGAATHPRLLVTLQKIGLGGDGAQRVSERPERSTEQDEILYQKFSYIT